MTMSSTHALIDVLKQELRAAGFTYAKLAPRIGLAESSVKRMFASADMPLSRIDAICRVLKIDFGELAQRVAEQRPQLGELTLEQAYPLNFFGFMAISFNSIFI